MKKYAIAPDFQKLSHLNPPIYRPVLPFIQKMMEPLMNQQKSTPDLDVRQVSIPIENHQSMKALLYIPKHLPSKAPALLDIHGGGFVFGAAPYHYSLARKYALGAGCIVLFIDYRLAPKHPFPAAVNDSYAAYCWLLEHTKALGIDPERIAVGGDSAGGQLAAVVSLMAREHHITPPCAQMLVYPAAGNADTPSSREFTDTPMCNSRDMDKYGKLYFSKPADVPSWYGSPIDADQKGMPFSYIETAEFDALRDGGKLLAQKLSRAGVPVVENHSKGTVHGYDFILKSPITKQSIEQRIAFLRKAFSQSASEEEKKPDSSEHQDNEDQKHL